jgi:hypothetical protein
MDLPELRRLFFAAPSLEVLDKMYRQLSKHTHPDLTGTDGQDFMQLRQVYEAARLQLLSPKGPAELGGAAVANANAQADSQRSPEAATMPGARAPWRQSGFDPWAALAHLGFAPPLAERACVYLLLQRFHTAGLAKRKVRSQASLKKRNEQIINGLYYWAETYQPNLVLLLSDYLEETVEAFRPTAYAQAVSTCRRHLEEGLGHFWRYQEEARQVSAQLARRSFENTIDTTEVYHLENLAPAALASWLLKELELPALGLSRS